MRDRRTPRRGLIPTHAGKTPRPASRGALAWAHPHSRGENSDEVEHAGRQGGSSPLTRGKHGMRGPLRRPLGLIPTHAGKTPSYGDSATAAGAHPHSRGENGLLLRGVDRATGSSPLTRGKRSAAPTRRRTVRLIPTHAGKTRRATKRAVPSRAHPHSRGENSCTTRSGAASQGSSPLTRGKHISLQIEILQLGLIPTHAGKTAGA